MKSLTWESSCFIRSDFRCCDTQRGEVTEKVCQSKCLWIVHGLFSQYTIDNAELSIFSKQSLAFGSIGYNIISCFQSDKRELQLQHYKSLDQTTAMTSVLFTFKILMNPYVTKMQLLFSSLMHLIWPCVQSWNWVVTFSGWITSAELAPNTICFYAHADSNLVWNHGMVTEVHGEMKLQMYLPSFFSPSVYIPWLA